MTQSQTTDTGKGDNPWPRAAVSAAVFHGGKVLLAQRGKPPLKGIWSLPGGHIEPGEKARVAVDRELAEETGIEADIRGLVDVADVILRHEDGSVSAHYVISVFYGMWIRGEPRPDSDCLAVEWVDLDEMEARPMTQGTPGFILRAAQLLRDPR